VPDRNGQCLLGWPDYQEGQVAVVFSTLFLSPRRYQSGEWETQVYRDASEAGQRLRRQVDFYHRLVDTSQDRFRLIRARRDLDSVLSRWNAPLPSGESTPAGNPVGLVLLLEGAEGLRGPEEIVEFWERGLRIVGPVWGGGRYCGGMYEPGGFTGEGYRLLELMAETHMILDLTHMSERSALQALEAYPGTIIASHANARALLRGADNERHLSDRTIRALAERGGTMGIVPFNKFLVSGWDPSGPRASVTLAHVADHIDHVCQLTGSARHVALGTDFDGGFGWPSVPLEIHTVANLRLLEGVLAQRGYSQEEIGLILHGNWQKALESALP
jgi:membrane dipeptidase